MPSDDEATQRPSFYEVELLLSAVRESTLNGEPARALRAIEAIREQADRYERDLIRSLRWDAKGNVLRTWAEVAELVDAGLNSRQAAHARWGLLKASSRGDAPRGRRPGPGL